MADANERAARYRLAGWLLVSAGGFALGAHFATKNPGFAAGATAFFVASVIFFAMSKRSRRG